MESHRADLSQRLHPRPSLTPPSLNPYNDYINPPHMSKSPESKLQQEAIMALITPLSERILSEDEALLLTPAEEVYLTSLWSAWEASLDL